MPVRKIAEAAPPARRRAAPRAAKASKAAPNDQARSDAPAPEAPPLSEVAAAPPVDQKIAPSGKLGVLVALLSRPEGATIVAMSEATGWLPHSVRGALSGALKKARGYAIASTPAEGGRVYRIVAGEAAR